MFDKILIANRGEIACRVMATAHRMGIATVAVYSDADAGARHVRMAGEAVRIGPAAASGSYLHGQAVIEAALATGAQAVHPGYGFLSENPGFVEAVEAAGLVFIGPPASAIRAMGLKDAAKQAVEAAGVPVVPGYHGAGQDPALLAREAEAAGYPVLIKARAGGGGKGMRLVERPEDFAAALEGAQSEALSSFGDGAVLIEKYIAAPRHVEIQVFADGHGNVVHLFERDCSLQRRHQKVIEEAPAPGMRAEVRAAMGAAAVEAARAIGYRGAGTVEFIADGSGGLREDGFWFMEMNTRLQVEHPVTEAVTGLDLVEWQLRVAAGEPLPLAQEDLALDGHAFEARIYAEDVPRGFLPDAGRISAMALPPAAEFSRGSVRVDSGVEAGDAVTPHYDPMIAKLIVHGPDRALALARLRSALAQVRLTGCVTNLGFLQRLAADAGFAAGEVDTGLIARGGEALTADPDPAPEMLAAAVYALCAGAGGPLAAPGAWQLWGRPALRAGLERKGARETAMLWRLGPDLWQLEGGPQLEIRPAGAGQLSLVCSGQCSTAGVLIAGDTVEVTWQDQRALWRLPDPLARGAAAGDAGGQIAAPMPGLVKRVHVAEGDRVTAGQALAVLEAMKMEHTLTAPFDGEVAVLACQEGAQVAGEALLMQIDPAEGGDD